MRVYVYILALAATLALGILGALFLWPPPENQADLSAINDITATLADNFDRLGAESYTLPGPAQIDYAVIDASGALRAATRRGLSEDRYAAARHRDTVMDIICDEMVVGKVIFWNDTETRWKMYRDRLQGWLIVTLTVMAGICALFFLTLYKRILRPFKRLRGFAQRVAAGDLDIPLEMDKRNAFGAFTESFDLMRDELRRARENERAAERSKRELVASLSHDIQTPVASIRAVAEVMEVTADDGQRKKLQVIQQKAGQIHALMADLFHATLEELNSLRVQPVSFPSDRLGEIIDRSDYQDRTRAGPIPGCLLRADPVRLSQAIDNIIANSYKYAGTPIDVSAEMEEDGLALVLRDYGPGADPDELPLLCGKYYRGKTAGDKNGYGMGLYISRTLLERMGGWLACENARPGFKVRLWLPLDR